MAEFTQVRKRGPAIKYHEHQQTLIEMGFDAVDVTGALESVAGNIEFAMAVLLGEPIPSVMGGSYTSRVLPPMKVVGKSQSSAAVPRSSNKPDIKEVHNKFMATYKIQKCKEKNSHDKRMCIGYHTKGDRRRNPFEILYACTECPTSTTETYNCPDGDSCLKSHNMLERMFHPELFKISMCQRGPNGSHCERGNLCAFAHSDEDHRVPLSHSSNKAAQWALATSEQLIAGKTIGDSRMLDSVQDKLIRLIKSHGTEGIISSELPKRFSDIYSERLDLTDEAGEKFRIKDLLLAHPCISVTMHKGVQPKYVWGEERYFAASTQPNIPTSGLGSGSAPVPVVENIIVASSSSSSSSNAKSTVSLNSIGGISKPLTSWASAVSSPAPATATIPSTFVAVSTANTSPSSSGIAAIPATVPIIAPVSTGGVQAAVIVRPTVTSAPTPTAAAAAAVATVAPVGSSNTIVEDNCIRGRRRGKIEKNIHFFSFFRYCSALFCSVLYWFLSYIQRSFTVFLPSIFT